MLFPCFLLPLVGVCQTPVFWELNQKNGLPTNQIYDVFQDSKGNIWFGSDLGIFRYNGYETKRFVPSDFSEEMSNISEDPAGRIWANNFTGQIFYVDQDSLKLFKDFSKNSGSYVTYNLLYFPLILSTSAQGIVATDFNSPKKETIVSADICRMPTDKGKYVGVARLSDYQMEDGSWQMLAKASDACYFLISEKLEVSNRTTILPEQNKGEIKGRYFRFLGKNHLSFTPSLIVELSKSGKTFHKTGNEVFIYNSSIFPDEENEQVLMGTNAGVLVIDKTMKTANSNNRWLPQTSVSSIEKDQEGNYWLGTLNGGLKIIPSLEVVHWNTSNSPLPNNQTKALATNLQGDLVVGFYNGNFIQIDTDSQIKSILENQNTQLDRIYLDPLSNEMFTDYGNAKSYSFSAKKWKTGKLPLVKFKNITAIGKEWVVSTPNSTNLFTESPSKTSQELLGNSFTRKPPLLFRKGGKQYQYFEIRGKKSMTTFYDQKRLWVGYTDGMKIYEHGTEREFLNPATKEKIYANYMLQTQNKQLWVATSRGKLLGFSDTTLVFNSDEANWLSPQGIYGFDHSRDTLVVSTTDGVYIINANDYSYQLINEADGLPKTLVSDVEISHGKVFLATFEGLFSFPLNYNKQNLIPPKIRIESVAIWEQDTTLQASYRLAHDQNNFKIDFIGIAHRSRGDFTYKYRMLGIDSAWLELPSQQNTVRYPSLPSGKFTFEVKVINEDGVESPTPARVDFHILKPYWETWWFLLLCFLGVSGLVGFLFWRRIRRIKRENELQAEAKAIQSELVKSSLVGLRAQMNPHFIFNALNSIQSYIYFNKKMLAVDYLSKFAKLMRLYLHQSKQEYISLSEELDGLTLYLELEKSRFEESFEYTIETSKDLNTRELQIPSMLLQPYVENAIKHGLLHKEDGVRKLDISFSESNKILKCVIQDNGIGRKASAEINQHRRKNHESFASNANERRLKLLNYERSEAIQLRIIDLLDSKQESMGTKVVLQIPKEIGSEPFTDLVQ